MARARISVGNTARVAVGSMKQTSVSVGIQGPPGISQTSLSDLSDIDVSALADGAVLVWNSTLGKWTANNIISNVIIEGGSF